jgi:Fe-S cluster biogenesis protein NfuA/nitrite reductase/ring-hydroxylating ferredoxin subunit
MSVADKKKSPVHSETDLEVLLKDIQALESVIATWGEQERNVVQALKLSIDALNKEALTRLIRTIKKEPTAMPALKDAAADEVVYSVMRHHGLIKPSLNERIEQALESVRPMLQGHGGNVELVSIDHPSTAVVRLIGACSGCPASELTLSEGVEKAIKEYCPEITEVVKAKGICSSASTPVNFVSPFARDSQKSWKFAADLSQITVDNIFVCEVDGQSLILSRFEDTVVCYKNACAHLGMALDMGEIKDGILSCPYHHFEYHLKSGECLTVPEVQLHTHAVRITDNKVEVSLL